MGHSPGTEDTTKDITEEATGDTTEDTHSNVATNMAKLDLNKPAVNEMKSNVFVTPK